MVPCKFIEANNRARARSPSLGSAWTDWEVHELIGKYMDIGLVSTELPLLISLTFLEHTTSNGVLWSNLKIFESNCPKRHSPYRPKTPIFIDSPQKQQIQLTRRKKNFGLLCLLKLSFLKPF
uniref:Uncharacterized protein n=1 Tax=Cacopsylla melanoneura TaxID=428564 RepID=A0A8D8SUR9_9HEMI